MKTKKFQIACLAVVFATISVFSVSAQSGPEFFFDKKYENGKVVSQTKYQLASTGLYEKDSYSVYSYDESGNLTKQERFKWNERNNTWSPVCCITSTFDEASNTITMELATWNGKLKKYNTAYQRAVYQMNESGKTIAWDFFKTEAGAETVTVSGKSQSESLGSELMLGLAAKQK